MGDISDMHDLERFMRSLEGKAHLEVFRQILLGCTVVDGEIYQRGSLHFHRARSRQRRDLLRLSTISGSHSSTEYVRGCHRTGVLLEFS